MSVLFLGSFPLSGSFPVSPPPLFKIPSFMFDLRVITAKCVMLRCKVEEQICSELSICSPRQISLHYDSVK